MSILEGIRECSGTGRVTQRELASRAGLSLGMTNVLVKRFVERGWVKLTRLSSRSVRYAMTSEGMAEMARRTAGFFRRAARNNELYRSEIEAFVLRAKRDGAATLVLAGATEMDYILEYACERHGLVFVRSADVERAKALGRKAGVALVLAGAVDGEGLGTPLMDIILGTASYLPGGGS